MSYTCGHCGSKDVAVKVEGWVNPNEGTDPAEIDAYGLLDSIEIKMSDKGDVYSCWDCGKVRPITELVVDEILNENGLWR